jgi:hypothetical protein
MRKYLAILAAFIPLTATGHTLGGSITGFNSGSYLVMRLNNTTSRIVPAGATSYRFSTQFSTGQPYTVSIGIQPAGLRCTIVNSAGVFQSANITNANITCVNLTSTQLSWSLPTMNTDGTPLTDLTGYMVYYGTDPTFATKVTKFISAPNLSTTISNLAVGSTYYFAVASVSASGGTGNRSNSVSVKL